MVIKFDLETGCASSVHYGLTDKEFDKFLSKMGEMCIRDRDFSNESFALIIALLMPATVDWYVVIMAVLAGVLIGKEEMCIRDSLQVGRVLADHVQLGIVVEHRLANDHITNADLAGHIACNAGEEDVYKRQVFQVIS